MEALRPPAKAGGGADEFPLPLEHDTACCLRVFQFLNRDKVAVDERAIGERPQMFRGPQFRRIRRQKQQVDMVGHTQALRAVPTRPIQHEHNLPGGVAPTVCAKAASSASKSGILTEVAR